MSNQFGPKIPLPLWAKESLADPEVQEELSRLRYQLERRSRVRDLLILSKASAVWCRDGRTFVMLNLDRDQWESFSSALQCLSTLEVDPEEASDG